jgi:hypothetical protein
VDSAIFSLEPCYEQGGGFDVLGDIAIYEDNFTEARNLTRPLPGARILSTQHSCTALDMTDLISDLYQRGDSVVQLRLILRNHQNNGSVDEVRLTPRLLINFEN